MEKNINLAKILNGKPVNTKLWSPLFGDVYTSCICSEDTIIVVNHHAESSSFYNNGKYFDHAEAEPLLFPSKEMRDWNKFAWQKGDILVNENNAHIIFEKFTDDVWEADLFSHYKEESQYPFRCIGFSRKYCIPYNKETAHLLGTTDEWKGGEG